MEERIGMILCLNSTMVRFNSKGYDVKNIYLGATWVVSIPLWFDLILKKGSWKRTIFNKEIPKDIRLNSTMVRFNSKD